MKRTIALALGSVLLASVANGDPPQGGKSGDKGSKPTKGGRADAAEVVRGATGKALDEYLTEKSRFPDGFSGSALAAKDGEILLAKGYGLADAKSGEAIRADSLWDWCSVTKQWTAAAILKLEMTKKLSLDDPLSKVLDDVPKDKAKVTLRHLLNHTSGIAGSGGPEFSKAESSDRESLVRWVLAHPVAAKPGEKWEYSNGAYFLLAAIVEKKSGTTWEKFLRKHLFAPAGMKDTFCIGDSDLPLDRVPLDARGTGPKFAYGTTLTWGYRGAGGVVSTVGDMLLWDRALRGDKILSPAAKKKYYEVGKQDYALGWEVKNENGMITYAHSGHTGKVVTYFLRCVEPDIVIAIALNEEPKQHPEITGKEMVTIVRNGSK